MLPERMKKGHWLLKGTDTASKILRVKKHPEYSEERKYVLRGLHGIETRPYEVSELCIMGYTEVVTADELNKRWWDGDFLPSRGACKLGKKLKKGKS